MIVILLFFAAVGALAVTAFCAGAETGFLSVSRGRIVHMVREGGARAKVIHQAISEMGRTTTALLVGENLASVTYSSAASALAAALFGDAALPRAAMSVISALALLFLGEFLPKLLCAARPLARLLALAPLWKLFARVFVPVGAVVQAVVERFMPRRDQLTKLTPEAVLKILKDRKDGVRLSDFESALVGRIMVLRARGEFITPDALLSALDDAVP